ncbi:DUF6146 family protein [Croceitalea vernalis]|uniref:DUF6146 family protein n=1 Tax=Croceitalea vernalis TaxID=3075599 RepID=A0ABU3BH00_9FLAO|nr:DUF6146 family protein [Croceitalea sp. P007]MDT0621401.1 DUF6146 family protein [Croceitalea sp. P007]
MKKKQLYYYIILGFLFILGPMIYGQDDEIVLTASEKELFDKNLDNEKAEVSNDSEYDIVIMDIGFNQWLTRIAQPKGYYTQSYMENRNSIYVLEWNRRVLDPYSFDPQLYELQINYEFGVDYGYDVNYQLYNYFIYFQRRYKQRLGPFLPRI